MTFGGSGGFNKFHDVHGVLSVWYWLEYLTFCFEFFFDSFNVCSISCLCIRTYPFTFITKLSCSCMRFRLNSSTKACNWHLGLVVEKIITIIKIQFNATDGELSCFILILDYRVNSSWTNSLLILWKVEKLWRTKETMGFVTSSLPVDKNGTIDSFLIFINERQHHFLENVILRFLWTYYRRKGTEFLNVSFIFIGDENVTLWPLLRLSNSRFIIWTWLNSNSTV